ncbi:MAG TPA: Uma2 family endonuclease [Blastocatellia bacterium]|jgi:Uma2 family endonuclease|nr:Uma2 family endonuclease [Blastocatellia bacterium]
MTTTGRATIQDLYEAAGKAEIVNGELVPREPTGDEPGYAGDEVFASLREHAKRTKSGRAVGDNKGFRVDLPNRDSFSPDAAFYLGPRSGMKFFEGAPLFAVEVRSENDYGTNAEIRLAEKRADYFAAGTLVVWDVDLLSPEVIRSYRSSDPGSPVILRRGEVADAEPAVPGWRMRVDDLFS